MAEPAGQTSSNDKQRQPYFGPRKVKIGNINADQRKLRDMMRSVRKKDAK